MKKVIIELLNIEDDTAESIKKQFGQMMGNMLPDTLFEIRIEEHENTKRKT